MQRVGKPFCLLLLSRLLPLTEAFLPQPAQSLRLCTGFHISELHILANVTCLTPLNLALQGKRCLVLLTASLKPTSLPKTVVIAEHSPKISSFTLTIYQTIERVAIAESLSICLTVLLTLLRAANFPRRDFTCYRTVVAVCYKSQTPSCRLKWWIEYGFKILTASEKKKQGREGIEVSGWHLFFNLRSSICSNEKSLRRFSLYKRDHSRPLALKSASSSGMRPLPSGMPPDMEGRCPLWSNISPPLYYNFILADKICFEHVQFWRHIDSWPFCEGSEFRDFGSWRISSASQWPGRFLLIAMSVIIDACCI